ncbi:unnamed protein product, partial [Larinioides sclopetarius]
WVLGHSNRIQEQRGGKFSTNGKRGGSPCKPHLE